MITMVKVSYPLFFRRYKEYPQVDFWKYGVVEHYIEHEERILDKINDVVDFYF